MFGVLWVFLRSVAGQILYLALHLETGRFPRPLTRGEELAAFDAMRAGDRDARDTLIRHNLRLVVHVTKKYYAAQSSQDDFISIGTIGLIKAVDTYDPSPPTRFASYATRCIENELRMQLRRTRREGTVASLQEPLEGDSGMLTLADVLPDEAVMEDGCEQRDAIRRLRALVDQLPDREREIIVRRYGLDGQPPLTQNELAVRLGISRSYVSRLEKHAMNTLRGLWETL